jgi:hypothetical protein
LVTLTSINVTSTNFDKINSGKIKNVRENKYNSTSGRLKAAKSMENCFVHIRGQNFKVPSKQLY